MFLRDGDGHGPARSPNPVARPNLLGPTPTGTIRLETIPKLTLTRTQLSRAFF